MAWRALVHARSVSTHDIGAEVPRTSVIGTSVGLVKFIELLSDKPRAVKTQIATRYWQ